MTSGRQRTGSVPWIWLLLVVAAYIGIWIWRLLGASVDGGFLSRTWLPVGASALLGSALTGTGGASTGFVSMPVFTLMQEAGTLRTVFSRYLASQFEIQLFASAVGMGLWAARLFGRDDGHREAVVEVQDFLGLVLATVCFAIPAAVLAQLYLVLTDRTLNTAFDIVSLVLGSILLSGALIFQSNTRVRLTVAHADLYFAMLIGIVGGALTGFFSLGVGEILGIYMIARRYPADVAIAAAFSTSFVTVLASLWYTAVTGKVIWELVLIGAPAAALGGWLAFWLLRWSGPAIWRIVVAAWMVGASLFMIVRALT